MKNKIICLLSLISLLLPSLTYAQQGNKPVKGAGPETILARLDTNQNGSLSKDEVRGRMAERFDTIDANGDGEISIDELSAARDQAGERMGEKGEKVKNADTDGNGAISIDEASAAGMDKLVEHFALVDIDGDGEISRKEMREFRKANQNRKGPGQ